MFVSDLDKKRAEDNQDYEMAKAIFMVEKEVNQHVGEEYLYLKFCSQIEQLRDYYDQQNREYNRMNKK